MYRTAYRTADIDGLKVFYRDPARQTRPRSCCCMDFPPPRGCGSRCWTGSSARSAWLHRTIPGSGTATRPARPSLPTPSTTWPPSSAVSPRSSACAATPWSCRTTAVRWDSGSQPHIPSDSTRSSSRTPSPTRTGSARCGRPGASSGPTARHTRPRCGRTSSPSRRRGSATSEPARTR